MVFNMSSKPKYVQVDNSELPEYDSELRLGGGYSKQKVQVSFSWLTLALLVAIPATSVTTLLVSNVARNNVERPSVACTQPSVRREWRTLDKADRANYVQAVQCLTSQPSSLRENGTAYDDFPWVHQKTHPTAHKSAPFLPWHRYYIHSYEKALKEQCAYDGVLPYWDWSQDSHNFEGSPIWDSIHGFGGDGAGAETIGNGRCVEDGPFAGTHAMFYEDRDEPHCLARGFAQGEDLAALTDLVDPDQLEELMNESDFSKFAPELERRAHTFISRSINGDFSKYTGPYDPVFFLHHANLDRLWSKWQQKHDPTAYAGKASMYSSAPASVNDMLDVGGLLNGVPVSEVMSTTSGMFCYQY